MVPAPPSPSPWPRALASHPDHRLVLRPLSPLDSSGLLTLEQAIAREGLGTVKTEGELPENEESMRRSLSPWLRGGLKGPEGLYLVVAAPDGSTVPIVAQAELRRLGQLRLRHVAMVAVSVHRSFRRQGLGRALMESLVTWGEERGVERFELSVRADNDPAIALYHALGFAIEGRRKGFVRETSGLWVDDLIMAKLSGGLAASQLKRE